MKFNLYALPTPVTLTETRTIAEPVQNGQEVTITLRGVVGSIEKFEIGSKYREFVKDYLPDEKGNTPGPVSIPGRDPMRPNDDLCAFIARFMVMLVPTDDFRAMSFEEWVLFAQVMPTVFSELVTWSNSMYDNAGDTLKKASAANTEGSSDSLSDTEPETIPA